MLKVTLSAKVKVYEYSTNLFDFEISTDVMAA